MSARAPLPQDRPTPGSQGQPTPGSQSRPTPGSQSRPTPGRLDAARVTPDGRDWPDALTRAAVAASGAAMIVVPAIALPARAQVLTAAGLLLVTATVAGPLARYPATGALAAMAAAVMCALARPGVAVLAVEGLLVLGYLFTLDAPAPVPVPVLARWLRAQAPSAAWGAASSAAVAGGLAIHLPADVWLVTAGMATAVAAAILAVPRRQSAGPARD